MGTCVAASSTAAGLGLLEVLACLSCLRITNVDGRESAKEFIYLLLTIREGIKRTGIVFMV